MSLIGIALGLIGGYIFWDGVYSYIRYENQKWYEELIRIVRSSLAIVLILIGAIV